jgi:hypothetical protein
MLGLDTLDVAIGLVLVYLVVSLVCSAAAELVEMLMKQRGKHLYDGIVSLLKTEAPNLYKQPLVQSLYKDTSLPSYIPSRNFALALLNMIGSDAGAADVQSIKSAIDSLKGKNDYLYNALSSIYLGAEGSVENVIKGIEDWFDSAMDRVSGWYKRYTQWWLLAFGIVAAVAINVDTIYIVRQLANNKAMREAIVATAGESLKTPPSSTAATTVEDAQKNLDQSLAKLKNAGLPVGWDRVPEDESWWQRIVGWVLTAVAVSFGAPFWFDVLNKIMVVRSTVKPKEKSPDEKSKDAK